MKARMKIDWGLKAPAKPDLERFGRYLRDKGYMPFTIENYQDCLKRYLASGKTVPDFLEGLHNRHLARNTINNYIIPIKAYHMMLGQPLDDLKILRKPEGIPYYFEEDDIRQIFGVMKNLKHKAMLYLMFYTCLRASELCSLDVEDIDLQKLILRIREGKGGKAGMIGFSNDCAAVMKDYLESRPLMEIGGRNPLFYTDFGIRWNRKSLYRMFTKYKKKAGIQKKGGVHVFGRHSPASLMVSRGCDIRVIKEILRHKSIMTTMRYAHISERTVKEASEQYLKL